MYHATIGPASDKSCIRRPMWRHLGRERFWGSTECHELRADAVGLRKEACVAEHTCAAATKRKAKSTDTTLGCSSSQRARVKVHAPF